MHCYSALLIEIVFTCSSLQITKPTRITLHSTTLIDNSFTNVTTVNMKCGVLCNDISYHLPIVYTAEYNGITKLEKNVLKTNSQKSMKQTLLYSKMS